MGGVGSSGHISEVLLICLILVLLLLGERQGN